LNKTLMAEGDDRLKGTKHLWLMNQEKIPDWRKEEFDEIRKTELKTARAWAIPARRSGGKESLRRFWDYRYPKNAQKYFKRWYFWATHSRLRPVIPACSRQGSRKDLEKPSSQYLDLLQASYHPCLPPGRNAVTEGLNSKIQMIKQMACGFRNREHYRKAILFHCGGLDLYARVPTQPGSLVHTTISCMTHGKL